MEEKKKSTVTVMEAAKILEVSGPTIRQWARRGNIKEYRHPINNTRRYKLEDIQKLADLINNLGE